MDARPIKALIVDDEPVARHVLRDELDQFPEIEVVGEAENGKEALQKIGNWRPTWFFSISRCPS